MLWNAAGLYTPRRAWPPPPLPTLRRRSSSPPVSTLFAMHSAIVGRWRRRAQSACGPRSRARAPGRSSSGRSASSPIRSSVYLPIVVAEGRGATLTDVDGNTFIDFTGGVGCLNVGHSHPRVVEAVQEQAARFLHTDFTIVPYEVYVDARRAAARARAVHRPGEGGVLQRRHRGGRERGQVRARVHAAGRR